MVASQEQSHRTDATPSDSSAQTVRDGSASHQSRGTLVTARLPADEFALAETLTAVSDLSVTGASLVTAGESGPLPLVWFQTTDPDSLAAALDGDPTVRAAEAIVHADERHLYRMEWDPGLDVLCQLLLTSHAVLLDAQASERHWTVEILYPDREALQQTDAFCEQYNLSFEIETIRTLDPEQTTHCGLTPDQYEALTVAWQMGYFAVPREANLEAVADEIGVSHQALSERLRRGHDTLISTVLGESKPTLVDSSVGERPDTTL